MRRCFFLCLAVLLSVGPWAGADEFEYIELKWEEGMPLTQIMEWVKDAMEKSPKFKVGGQLKGFVFDDKFKAVKTNFSSNLKIPVRRGHTPDQDAQVMLSLFHTILEINNYALVDRGTVFQILLGGERKEKPIRLYSQEEAKDLPADDILIAQLYTFKSFDPGKLQSVITPFLNPKAGEGVTPILETRTVVITALSSKMREIYKLLDIVDQNTSAAEITFIGLKHANASEIQETITSILKIRQQAASRITLPGGRESAQVLVTPNPRTDKEMIVLAPPDETREIRALIEKLDTELKAGETTLKYFRIKHRNANEVKSIIDKLYDERKKMTGQAGAKPGQPPPGFPGRPPGEFPPGGADSDEFHTAMIPPQIVADANNLGPDGKVVAGPDGTASAGGTNTLIVIAPSERVLKDVEKIIQELDRRKPVVAIEAIVMELGPDASRDIGVELAAGDEPSRRIRGAGVTSLGLSTPDFSTAPPGRTPPAGGLTAYLFKDTATRIPFLIRLQETDSMTDVLARPTLIASDNETATFNISRQEPYQKQETTSGGVITTSQAFERAETILEFTPNISVEVAPARDKDGNWMKDEAGNPILESPRKYVRLKVRQKIESFKGAASFAGGTPPKESREANTTVTILDGDTVAIGGFASKNKRSTVNKVPVLGDVPLLGWLFRRKQDTDSMTTLFIFITPHIVDDLGALGDLPEQFRTQQQVDELKKRFQEQFSETLKPGDPKK